MVLDMTDVDGFDEASDFNANYEVSFKAVITELLASYPEYAAAFSNSGGEGGAASQEVQLSVVWLSAADIAFMRYNNGQQQPPPLPGQRRERALGSARHARGPQLPHAADRIEQQQQPRQRQLDGVPVNAAAPAMIKVSYTVTGIPGEAAALAAVAALGSVANEDFMSRLALKLNEQGLMPNEQPNAVVQWSRGNMLSVLTQKMIDEAAVKAKEDAIATMPECAPAALSKGGASAASMFFMFVLGAAVAGGIGIALWMYRRNKKRGAPQSFRQMRNTVGGTAVMSPSPEGATAAQRRDAPIDIAHVIGPTGRATHTV
eukprot:g1549.t1